MDEFHNEQLHTVGLPSVRDINYEALQPKYLYILYIHAFIIFFVMLGVLIYLWTVVDKPIFQDNFQWILIGFLAFFLLNAFVQYKAFQFKAYAFRQKDISYKTGWLWRSMTTVPFNRVQHCEVSQGVFDRYFGLAKLKIFTAGGSSSDVSIPGLWLDQASDLKGFILEKIKEDE